MYAISFFFSYLNEGTGSLSRSFRLPWASRRMGLHLNEGTGSLSRSYLVKDAHVAARVLTSTKGPGVYPGHLVLLPRLGLTSSIPQRRDREFIPVIGRSSCSLCRFRCDLNEGTGSLSRSCACKNRECRLVLLTSTKGPGVYPGHRRTRRAGT